VESLRERPPLVQQQVDVELGEVQDLLGRRLKDLFVPFGVPFPVGLGQSLQVLEDALDRPVDK